LRLDGDALFEIASISKTFTVADPIDGLGTLLREHSLKRRPGDPASTLRGGDLRRKG